MAIEQVELRTFIGGLRDALAADDFGENEWAELYGLLIEPDGRLRSQWSSHWMAPEAVDLSVSDGLLVYSTGQGSEPWQTGATPSDADPDPQLGTQTWEDVVLFWDYGNWDEKLWALGGETLPGS